jgi:hypothetical protein
LPPGFRSMGSVRHVEFDELRGEVRAGAASATYAPIGRGGELRIGGEAGPRLRPVTFGERSAAAADALGAPRPRASLCGALRLRATVEVGAGARVASELFDCVVLALAGADDERAPSFADTALSVLRATGGELTSLLDAPAREVDRLSIALVGDDIDDDALWPEPAPEALAPAVARDRLADALLMRAAAPAGRTRTSNVVPFPATHDPPVQTWEPEPEMPPVGRRPPARTLGPVAPAREPGRRGRAQRRYALATGTVRLSVALVTG